MIKSPYQIARSSGLLCNGLADSQLKLLQRFQPDFSSNREGYAVDVFTDTNGFFISKFLKEF